jgi:thiamine monophosphate synthase
MACCVYVATTFSYAYEHSFLGVKRESMSKTLFVFLFIPCYAVGNANASNIDEVLKTCANGNL